ncbi:sensor histidine kinase [Allomuricauda sp. SCSIO 65647]|uniref:sensor histidine kinase n=1 Tax=Allomuricauda sp. SCSIO 65647 TaxID=2908843 RepID=UPI001F3C0D41|nr:sensor histidine kinase [Muricauda sp. SCSIO 65647]UJH66859.1 sensor histidine kinase [Muricauda sp. SCSIO 65647]
MKIPTKDKYRLEDKTQLVLKVNYFASLFALLFGLICSFLLNIQGVLPYTFLCFAVLNLLNTLFLKSHGNLTITYNVTSILAMVSAILITLFSGGIQSPFIYVLGIVVFAGYVTTRVYGKIYLAINLIMVGLIFLHDLSDFNIAVDTVPLESKDWFAFLSIILAVYLLGGVFGKNLLRAHHKLYRSKQEIEERIQEKETLLKEVHHRVKNNLQTVSSLLSLQSRAVEDKKISSIIKNSQNRVVSMAMVHEMLYKRDDYLSKIELRPYVQELCEYLIRSIKGNTNNITLNVDIPDYKLSIDTVIPLGLVINETVTNALKYGIVGDNPGELTILLKALDGGRYEMFLGDNGKGFPKNVGPKTTPSLGLKLIHNLARQLRGSVTRETEKKGTYYRLIFEEIVEDFNSLE